MGGYYDTAEVCLAGHPTTGSLSVGAAHTARFCETCGEKTIRSCPSCNTAIRGKYQADNVLNLFTYTPPSYCYSCGKALRWTERRIRAATDLSRESGDLTEEESQLVESSLRQISADTPETPVAATRLRRLFAKLGSGVGGAVRDIAVDLASETAKKILLP